LVKLDGTTIGISNDGTMTRLRLLDYGRPRSLEFHDHLGQISHGKTKPSRCVNRDVAIGKWVNLEDDSADLG